MINARHAPPLAFVALASALTPSPAVTAQTNIDPLNKFSWSENCGWMNWRDAGRPPGSQGAVVAGTFLSGFVWCENTGWVNLGNGAPADGVSYANPISRDVVGVPDFGVNLDPATGALSGFAWGENAGWINFSLPGLPAIQQPRLDLPTGRLLGYAWGENVGWVNLDSLDDGKHVAIRACAPDFNHDGHLDADDLSDYITCFFDTPPCAAAEFNADGNVNADDLSDFITAYFQGCG